LYYQKPPFSTNEVFLGSKGGVSQLVDHGPEGVRPGYQGEPWRIKQQAKNIKVQKETWNKIAEAMLKADTTGNFEYMMSNIETQKKVHEGKVRYEKGMLSKNMQNVIYGGKRGEKYLYPLAQNDTALKYIANKLKEADPANFGGDVDRVLDILEESKDFSQESTRLTWQEKKLAESSKMRDQFAKGEKWMMDNGHRFDDPAKFEAAYIKRFGRNNAFIKAINNKTHHYFSPDFNVDIVGAKTFVGEGSKLNKKLGKNIFSAVIYHMNEDVKNSITAEFKKALSGDVPTVKYQARKTLSQSPLLKKFGLDKEIRGPISRLIIKEVGDKMYDNIQTFRKPRIGTWGLLNYLEDVVDPKYKGAITEAKKALDYAVKNKWPEAKKALKIADNINWDHKVSSFLIDAGYADKLEYAKLQPTTEHFNKKIKRDQFDKPMGRLIKEYENAPASKKGSVIQKMQDLKDNFSRKYGGYMRDVTITADKTGKPIFKSQVGPLTKKTDVVKSLQTSLAQEKGYKTWGKDWNKIIKSSKAKTMAKALELAGIPICSDQLAKASGGRIGFAEKVCGMEYAKQNEDAFMKKVARNGRAAAMFASGKIKPFLMQAKNWGKVNMGPTGWIGGELLIVGLGTAWDMSKGKGWKEAMDNWTGLGGHFGQAEKRLKQIGIEQGYSEEQINDAMKIGQLMDLSTEAEEKQWELEQIQEQQDIGGTARYKTDPKRRFARPRGYLRGEYQDPKFVRDLKTEVPKIWEEGSELYKSLKDFDFSTELYSEMQQRKKREEYDKMMRLRSKPMHLAYGQQFPVSGKPEYKPWTPSYAGGGLANLTRTVAPDSGPVSRGLRSLYIDDMD